MHRPYVRQEGPDQVYFDSHTQCTSGFPCPTTEAIERRSIQEGDASRIERTETDTMSSNQIEQIIVSMDKERQAEAQLQQPRFSNPHSFNNLTFCQAGAQAFRPRYSRPDEERLHIEFGTPGAPQHYQPGTCPHGCCNNAFKELQQCTQARIYHPAHPVQARPQNHVQHDKWMRPTPEGAHPYSVQSPAFVEESQQRSINLIFDPKGMGHQSKPDSGNSTMYQSQRQQFSNSKVNDENNPSVANIEAVEVNLKRDQPKQKIAKKAKVAEHYHTTSFDGRQRLTTQKKSSSKKVAPLTSGRSSQRHGGKSKARGRDESEEPVSKKAFEKKAKIVQTKSSKSFKKSTEEANPISSRLKQSGQSLSNQNFEEARRSVRASKSKRLLQSNSPTESRKQANEESLRFKKRRQPILKNRRSQMLSFDEGERRSKFSSPSEVTLGLTPTPPRRFGVQPSAQTQSGAPIERKKNLSKASRPSRGASSEQRQVASPRSRPSRGSKAEYFSSTSSSARTIVKKQSGSKKLGTRELKPSKYFEVELGKCQAQLLQTRSQLFEARFKIDTLKKKLKRSKADQDSYIQKVRETEQRLTEFSEQGEREKLDRLKDKINTLRNDISGMEYTRIVGEFKSKEKQQKAKCKKLEREVRNLQADNQTYGELVEAYKSSISEIRRCSLPHLEGMNEFIGQIFHLLSEKATYRRNESSQEGQLETFRELDGSEEFTARNEADQQVLVLCQRMKGELGGLFTNLGFDGQQRTTRTGSSTFFDLGPTNASYIESAHQGSSTHILNNPCSRERHLPRNESIECGKESIDRMNLPCISGETIPERSTIKLDEGSTLQNQLHYLKNQSESSSVEKPQPHFPFTSYQAVPPKEVQAKKENGPEEAYANGSNMLIESNKDSSSCQNNVTGGVESQSNKGSHQYLPGTSANENSYLQIDYFQPDGDSIEEQQHQVSRVSHGGRNQLGPDACQSKTHDVRQSWGGEDLQNIQSLSQDFSRQDADRHEARHKHSQSISIMSRGQNFQEQPQVSEFSELPGDNSDVPITHRRSTLTSQTNGGGIQKQLDQISASPQSHHQQDVLSQAMPSSSFEPFPNQMAGLSAMSKGSIPSLGGNDQLILMLCDKLNQMQGELTQLKEDQRSKMMQAQEQLQQPYVQQPPRLPVLSSVESQRMTQSNQISTEESKSLSKPRGLPKSLTADNRSPQTRKQRRNHEVTQTSQMSSSRLPAESLKDGHRLNHSQASLGSVQTISTNQQTRSCNQAPYISEELRVGGRSSGPQVIHGASVSNSIAMTESQQQLEAAIQVAPVPVEPPQKHHMESSCSIGKPNLPSAKDERGRNDNKEIANNFSLMKLVHHPADFPLSHQVSNLPVEQFEQAEAEGGYFPKSTGPYHELLKSPQFFSNNVNSETHLINSDVGLKSGEQLIVNPVEQSAIVSKSTPEHFAEALSPTNQSSVNRVHQDQINNHLENLSEDHLEYLLSLKRAHKKVSLGQSSFSQFQLSMQNSQVQAEQQTFSDRLNLSYMEALMSNNQNPPSRSTTVIVNQAMDVSKSNDGGNSPQAYQTKVDESFVEHQHKRSDASQAASAYSQKLSSSTQQRLKNEEEKIEKIKNPGDYIQKMDDISELSQIVRNYEMQAQFLQTTSQSSKLLNSQRPTHEDQGIETYAKSQSGPIIKSQQSVLSSSNESSPCNGARSSIKLTQGDASSSMMEDLELKQSGLTLKQQIKDLGKEIRCLSNNLQMTKKS